MILKEKKTADDSFDSDWDNLLSFKDTSQENLTICQAAENKISLHGTGDLMNDEPEISKKISVTIQKKT